MTPERLAAAFDGPSPALAATLLGCRLTVVAPDGAVTVRLTETEAYGDAGADPGDIGNNIAAHQPCIAAVGIEAEREAGDIKALAGQAWLCDAVS